MTTDYQSPVYMQAFRCLGGDCEDTCCQQWDIRFDRVHYEKLRVALNTEADTDGVLGKSLVLNESEQASERNYAHIRLNDKGFCPFLDASGLCQLHSRFGIEPLSDICAFYPRVFSAYQGRIEMTGAMSCPEVVRRCLFSEASQLEMSPLNTDCLPRTDGLPLSRDVPASGMDFYAEHFPLVRDTLIWLARHEDYAFETRLYFISNFCHRLAPAYHQACEPRQKQLDDELRRIRSAKTLANLDDYYMQYTSSEPVAMVVVQAVLQWHMQQSPDGKLADMCGEIFNSYRTDIQVRDDGDIYGENLPPEQLWQSYQRRWDALNAQYGLRLEQCLTRYLVNCLQREWFISMPDPFAYFHLLTIRLAILRFLIVSHPHLQACLKDNGDQAEMDRQLVEIVYRFARGIDHNLAFLRVVYEAMLEQQMMSFDYAMPFIKF